MKVPSILSSLGLASSAFSFSFALCEKDGGGWGVISLPLSGVLFQARFLWPLQVLTSTYKLNLPSKAL